MSRKPAGTLGAVSLALTASTSLVLVSLLIHSAPIRPMRRVAATTVATPTARPRKRLAAPRKVPVVASKILATSKPSVVTPAVIIQPAKPATSSPTGWVALDAAIARIPNLQPGIVRWVVKDTGDWANTDMSTGTVYVAPRAPEDLLFSIVAHEYGHVLQGRIYGSLDAAVTALQPYFGNVGEPAIERAADCMAILEGATWTNYTSCQNAAWRHDASILLAGRRLS